MADQLLFDGADIGAYFKGFTIGRSIMPDVELATIDVAGRNGTTLNGVRLKPLAITVSGRLAARTASEARTICRLLGSTLNVSEPKALILPDETDVFYRAVVNGSTGLTRSYENPPVSITFYVPEACSYGRTRAAIDIGTTETRYDVGGMLEVWPIVSASVTSGNTYTIANGSTGEFLTIPSCSTTGRLFINMEKETATIGATAQTFTLASDFFSISPPSVCLSATHASTVTWYERYI